MLAVLVGILSSLIASWLFVIKIQPGITTLDIPVLITAQDAQGGQFQLGVRRAAEWATAFGLDEVGARRIRPRFIDERSEKLKKDSKEVQDVVNTVLAYDPPIVVGPLTSTAAVQLVPQIANIHHVPMILGIPTRPDITDHTDGRVWRLSPTDRSQAESVAQVTESLKTQHKEMQICLLRDDVRNTDYSKSLTELIENALDVRGFTSVRKATLGSRDPGQFDSCYHYNPDVVIFVGMPEMGRVALAQAHTNGIHAVWIFTDGCIERGFIQEAATSIHSGTAKQIFFTFQGPYPAFRPIDRDSPSGTLEQYIWYTRNLGGSVSGVVDADRCKEQWRSAATSYEVFGFDSYLIALQLIKRAYLTGGVSRNNLQDAMRTQYSGILDAPDLLLGPYELNDHGDNQKLDFHVYQLTPEGCLQHSELCPNKACRVQRTRVNNMADGDTKGDAKSVK